MSTRSLAAIVVVVLAAVPLVAAQPLESNPERPGGPPGMERLGPRQFQGPGEPRGLGPSEGWQLGKLLDVSDWQDRDLRELVEIVKIVKLSQHLGLSQEETVLLVREVEQARKTASELSQKRSETMQQLRDLIQKNAGEGEIQGALDRLVALDRQLAETKFSVFEKAGANLTASQRAKLYLFTQEFEGHMRQLVERARQVRRGEGPWGQQQPMGEQAPGIRRPFRTAPGESPAWQPGRGPEGTQPMRRTVRPGLGGVPGPTPEPRPEQTPPPQQTPGR